MPDDRPHFFDHTPDTLGELFQTWGLARFRAKQVMDWVYAKGVADPQLMTNLSAKDRDLLTEKMRFLDGAVIQHQRATDGTEKLLVDWSLDAQASHSGTSLTVLGSSETQTECVMIPSTSQESGRTRRTACISSQVGCPVGCKFCASGLGGLDGNLTTGQIVQQAWQLSHDPSMHHADAEPLSGEASGTPTRGISNIVFMGMGEPMANLRNVLPAVRTLAADWGMGLSARKITVSTVGVPAGIRKLADLDLPVTLAISLHAPNDEIRKRIIPWAEFVSIEQLTDAGRDYFNKTGREITLEYILLGGINDQPEHAHELVGVTRKLRSNVNLIRYNEVAGLPFLRPSDNDVHTFQNILQQAGVNTHIRASRGRDIAAACGQLRHEATSV
ncbi:MAG: 23S rRNA (adenine(2503)-C(2))-methyltransferase RlmN [Planctomycetota bacterium]